MLKTLLYIGTGSFIGGISRYLLSKIVQQSFLSSFPYGTFTVNFIGCFLIGLLFGISQKDGGFSNEWKMFLIVGFCGGFTTFSTFAYENVMLLKDGNYLLFSLYTGLSVLLGIAAVLSGNAIIKLI